MSKSDDTQRNVNHDMAATFQAACDFVERQLGLLLDALPDGVVVADTAGKIVSINSEAEKMFGYQPDDLVSQQVEVLIPDRFRDYHVTLRNGYLADPDQRPMGQDVLKARRQDGSEFPADISLSPMHTEAGLLICIAIRDATERTRVESALRASEEQVRSLLDSTAESIYGLDLQGNCTFCNQACVTTLGFQHAKDLLGKNMHNLIHHTRSDGTNYPMHESRIYETFRTGRGTHVNDEVFWKSDGTSFPAEYRSFPLRRDGELVGSVVTFLDITEQKRAAEALRKQQAELTHGARLSTLGEMAAGLAHEINQPLTAISAFAEGALARIQRDNLSETDTASIFTRIAEDAQRAGEIIRRLRNFVQKRESQRQQVDINNLVGNVYKFIESNAKQRDVTIRLQLADDLPEIEADPIEFQQVLVNLVRNSFDAFAKTNPDARQITISSLINNPDRIEVIVEDSGPGIPDQMVNQIFEPFYTSKSDGLGIGLGICQNIVESHHGKIWLSDSSNGGARFHFQLPRNHIEDEINGP